MAKKDQKPTTSLPSHDFFSEIALELRSQVHRLTPDSNTPPVEESGIQNHLFSVPESKLGKKVNQDEKNDSVAPQKRQRIFDTDSNIQNQNKNIGDKKNTPPLSGTDRSESQQFNEQALQKKKKTDELKSFPSPGSQETQDHQTQASPVIGQIQYPKNTQLSPRSPQVNVEQAKNTGSLKPQVSSTFHMGPDLPRKKAKETMTNPDTQETSNSPHSSDVLEISSNPDKTNDMKNQNLSSSTKQNEVSNTHSKKSPPKPFVSSSSKTIVSINNEEYKLEQAIFQSADRVVWRSNKVKSNVEQLFLIEEISIERFEKGYKSMPLLGEVKILRPDAVQETDHQAFLVFRKPSGHRIKEKLEDFHHQWPLDEIRHIIKTIGYTLAAIHETGHLFLQLDSRHIWMENNQDPLLLSVERLYRTDTPYQTRPVREGFSAPEVYAPNGIIGPQTDIFSLGILLHYMISHAPSFNHLDTANPSIPSPRVYKPHFPVGLDQVVLRACDPDPAKRFQRVNQFLGAFERACKQIEQRRHEPKKQLKLSIGHDIHIGINKGTRNPINQDSLFWRYDRTRGKGLFLIADGVSHCHYGSGDRASSILACSARQQWELLLKSSFMEQESTPTQRQDILSSIAKAANNTIAHEINQRFDTIDGYVEDAMGSTYVIALIDGNCVTIGNLGDSRAYLKSSEGMNQITIDHDYKTAQIQALMDLRSVSTLMGSSLITRCAGAFNKDEQLKLVPRHLDIDFFELVLLPGDILLLCSDGLSDYAGNDDEEAILAISQILETYPDPLSACFWLVALANQHGGGDNISLIEIKIVEE